MYLVIHRAGQGREFVLEKREKVSVLHVMLYFTYNDFGKNAHTHTWAIFLSSSSAIDLNSSVLGQDLFSNVAYCF